MGMAAAYPHRVPQACIGKFPGGGTTGSWYCTFLRCALCMNKRTTSTKMQPANSTGNSRARSVSMNLNGQIFAEKT